MGNLKKILTWVGAVALVAVAAVWFLTDGTEHVEDINGPDNYKLQTITDSNIIKRDMGALNVNEHSDSITNTTTYSSEKFTGVYEVYSEVVKGNRFDITVNHARVDSGNFRMVLVHNDEIVHDFKLNELTQTYTLENPSGYVGLIIAGESADFQFDYQLY